MVPAREVFLGFFLLAYAPPLAAGAPVMSIEEVDLSTESPIADLKVFLTGDAEVPPLFLLGVRWDPLRLEFLGVTWRETIFQPSGGPPFVTVKPDPEGKPVAGIYTVGFCDPCEPRIPAGERVPIANLRFARLPGFSGETSTPVRLVRAPPLGSIAESMEPHLYAGGWVKVETRDGLVRLHQTHPFLRADANFDGTVDISDPVGTLAALFQGVGDLYCPDAADSNDDGAADITDSIYTLSFLFTGGPPSPAPSPAPGLDPTPDALGCDHFPCRREKLVFEDKPEVPWDFVEFCIPDQEDLRQQVLEVYPEVRFLPESAGRIGCSAEEILCVIDWFALDHWKVCELSQLPFVGEIRGSYFE